MENRSKRRQTWAGQLLYSVLLIGFAWLSTVSIANGQVIDTLLHVGNYTLHVTIIQGKGTPILLEAGGGDNGNVWKAIAEPLATITDAPVITYDRVGLGKSSKDSAGIFIDEEVQLLRTALATLGYNQQIMLVAHSLGGFYSTLYAARYPNDVKAILFVDTNLPCFFTEQQLQTMKASRNFRNTVQLVKQNPIPLHIPVTDIVADQTLFDGTPDADRWKECHKAFAEVSPQRQGLTAYKSGHYVFFSNRQLVLNAIVTLYANKVAPSQKSIILERGYSQELTAANNDRQSLMNYWHSEGDLNEWGYSLLKQKQVAQAIEVFKLNVILHPTSANAYDSLAEAYEINGDKPLAIQNYKQVLRLNPNSTNAARHLEQLEK